MPGRLQGKTALVTAAGQGIGRASALAMAAEGATVIATDIDESLLAEVAAAATGDLRTRRLDVLNQDDVATVVGTEPLDVLFNCAGFVHHGSILDATEAEWDFAFALNARAQFRTIRAALPGMLERGRGSIVNMSSAASSILGVVDRCVYSASKAAVIGLTKSVARDYVARGIRCNAIAPGTVESPSWHARVRALGEAIGDVDKARADFVARQPMGRVGTPEEIAALVVYLASDESAFTTGQVHVIDGGWAI